MFRPVGLSIVSMPEHGDVGYAGGIGTAGE